MTKKRSFLTLENTLYLALFALALALRLYHLGAHPLNDPEAREALAVLRFLRGQPNADLPLAASPAYFFFTTFSFLIFPPSDFSARFAPALFGAGLALLPILFRQVIGRGPALITAGLLAVSNSLLAASRSAHGASLALFALVLGLGLLGQFVMNGRRAWLIGGAAALGVGLASGPMFLTSVLVLGIVLVVAARSSLADEPAWAEAWSRLSEERVSFGVALGLGLLLTATVGLVYPSGLGALSGSWLAWLTGFAPAASTGRSVLALPAFLIVYEPLSLMFGVVGAVRSFRRADVIGQLFTGFALISFLFILFYNGRALFDSVWVVLPLTVLAARAIFDLVRENWPVGEWPLVAAQCGVFVVMAGFTLIQMADFSEQSRLNPGLYQAGLQLSTPGLLNLVYVLVALAVLVVIIFLFAAGWSARATTMSVTAALAGVLLVMTLGAGWGLTQRRPNDPVELWWQRPATADLNRLIGTLSDVSNFSVGHPSEIVVTVQAWQDPQKPLPASEALKAAQTGALAWALRDFPKAAFVGELDQQIDSPVVIAPAQVENPTLGSSYVGQAFPLYRFWFPENMFWHEQLGWLTFRRAPVQTDNVILWVRQDVQMPQSAQPQP